VHRTIIKSGRHGPIQFVQKTQQIFFRRSFYILGFYGHPVFEKHIFSTDIGYAVYLHTGIAAFSVQTVKSPGTVIFKAAGKYADTTGIQSGCNRVTMHPPAYFAVIVQ